MPAPGRSPPNSEVHMTGHHIPAILTGGHLYGMYTTEGEGLGLRTTTIKKYE